MRNKKTYIRIGNVRLTPDIITAYLPLWTEGRITGMAIYIDNRPEPLKAVVGHDEATLILQRLDILLDLNK